VCVCVCVIPRVYLAAEKKCQQIRRRPLSCRVPFVFVAQDEVLLMAWTALLVGLLDGAYEILDGGPCPVALALV